MYEVHAPRRGRAEGAGGVARGRLRRAGVIDRVVLDVIGQPLPAFEPLAQLGVRQIARHDQRAGEREPRLHRILRQLRQDVLHRPAQVDLDHLPAELFLIDLGQILRRIVLELLEEHAVLGDLAERLAVGGAGDAQADRQRSAMPRQADDAHVVAEILAAELRPDSQGLRHLQHLRLHLEIAEGVAVLAALGRQRVVDNCVEASFTVFMVSSADVPPMTMAR